MRVNQPKVTKIYFSYEQVNMTTMKAETNKLIAVFPLLQHEPIMKNTNRHLLYICNFLSCKLQKNLKYKLQKNNTCKLCFS